MRFRQRRPEQIRQDALNKAITKLAESCDGCSEGWFMTAREHGATEDEIAGARAEGERQAEERRQAAIDRAQAEEERLTTPRKSRRKILKEASALAAAAAVSQALLPTAAAAASDTQKGSKSQPHYAHTVLSGEGERVARDQTLSHTSVGMLAKHLEDLGYRRADDQIVAARLSNDGRTTIQVIVPFARDEDHFSFILHSSAGPGHDDIVAVEADITRLRQLNFTEADHRALQRRATKADGHLDIDAMRQAGVIPDGRQWIALNGTVVEGHACDFWGCWWPNVVQCCGPAAFGCLAMGPFWWQCLTGSCGTCMVIESWWCGCW